MRIRLSGAALAFGGGDAGLGTPDLAFEVVSLAETLCFDQLCFTLFELLLEGLLSGPEVDRGLLVDSSPPMVTSDHQIESILSGAMRG